LSDKTKIEWTDATINVINGCTVVSPGCTNCYAMKQAHRFPVRQGLTRQTKGGMVWTGEVRFHEPALQQVLRWKRPRKIFWNAHGDTFHEAVPSLWIDRCFAVMAATPQHIHQVLTKRPERLREYAYQAMGCGEHWLAHCELSHAPMWPLPNVWLGVSVEDQPRAEERIPILLDTPAAIRWLSMEPLLGEVDLSPWLGFWEPGEQIRTPDGGSYTTETPRAPEPLIDWVVLGGESGPHARPMHPAWERAVRAQCEAAGVPYLFKQWGEWGHPRPPIRMADDPAGSFRKVTRCWFDKKEVKVHQFANGESVCKVGKKAAGRMVDGRTFDGYPA